MAQSCMHFFAAIISCSFIQKLVRKSCSASSMEIEFRNRQDATMSKSNGFVNGKSVLQTALGPMRQGGLGAFEVLSWHRHLLALVKSGSCA